MAEDIAGTKYLLILPHKQLSEVPWAALIDADGRYLIERHVIRVAPSLRVARQAADSLLAQAGGDGSARGHVVLVGNPLPTRFAALPYAEEETLKVEDILNKANVEVQQQHFFRSDRKPQGQQG